MWLLQTSLPVRKDSWCRFENEISCHKCSWTKNPARSIHSKLCSVIKCGHPDLFYFSLYRGHVLWVCFKRNILKKPTDWHFLSFCFLTILSQFFHVLNTTETGLFCIEYCFQLKPSQVLGSLYVHDTLSSNNAWTCFINSWTVYCHVRYVQY